MFFLLINESTIMDNKGDTITTMAYAFGSELHLLGTFLKLCIFIKYWKLY